MIQLYIAATVFVAMHVLIAGTALRGRLVGRLGEGPYMGLFSLASVASLVWLGLAFAGARGHAGDTELWGITPPLRHTALGLVFLGFLLIVPGLLTPNPTSVAQQGVLDSDDPARGIVRVTRHPFLWGVAIWACAHMLSNGDLASLVLFGSLLVLALVGPPSIDHKRALAFGERWAAFRDKTSAVPFAAILQGRQKFVFSEVAWKLGLAVAVYAAVIVAHPYLFGVSPLG